MQRQISKGTHHQEIRHSSSQHPQPSLDQIYACACGKEYKSFAAIYLHFRTKHDIKLSTRPSESRCQVDCTGPMRRFVYNADPDIEKEEDDSLENSPNSRWESNQRKKSNKPKQERVEVCVRNYLNSHPLQDKEIYLNFIKFLKGSAKQISESQEQPLSSQTLPYYFNTFAVEFLPDEMPRVRQGTLKWKKACYSLQKFADWLKEEKKTDLVVICQVE